MRHPWATAAGIRRARRGFPVEIAGMFVVMAIQAQQFPVAAVRGIVVVVVVAVVNGGERWCEAEVHRLKGEILLAYGSEPDEIETSYRRAVEVAREQRAKSLELRAAINLSRLWLEKGETGQAHSSWQLPPR